MRSPRTSPPRAAASWAIIVPPCGLAKSHTDAVLCPLINALRRTRRSEPMMPRYRSSFLVLGLLTVLVTSIAAQHDHPAPEKLGTVAFPTSCTAAAQPQFNRAVALLYSFAYSESEKVFREVLATDPSCAMAHWGVAMTYFHE